MKTGVVKRLFKDKGFGFIKDDKTSKKYFFHTTQCNSNFDAMQEGDAVSFDIEDSPKDPRAKAKPGSNDNWSDKGTFVCKTCQYYVSKETHNLVNAEVGRCRYNPPQPVIGFAVVYPSDFCGHHKLGNSPR